MNLPDDFFKKKVLVIGDLILDVSTFSKTIGLSLETPTLKVKKLSEKIELGGAGNIVKNIIALGGECTFISVIGDEDSGYIDDYNYTGLNFLKIHEKNRKVILKNRIWVDRSGINYKYLQVNSGDHHEINEESKSSILEKIFENDTNYDAALLVDYNGGIFLDRNFCQKIIKSLKDKDIKVISSSQVSGNNSRHHNFSNSNIIFMNKNEAASIYPNFKEGIGSVKTLSEMLNSDICVTLGDKGSIALVGGYYYKKSAMKFNSIDTCGAGDAFVSCFSLCNNDVNISLSLSNIWAGLSTTHSGTSCSSLKSFVELTRK